MKAEQEKISAKVRAVSMHLNGGKLQLPAEEESCYVVLVAESGCTLQYAEQTMLLNPGSALLLGPGGGCIQQTGSAAPELVGCSFPLSALHELRTQTQRDFSRLFEPEQSAVLYGSVQWNSRLRTLLELMRTAMEEPDYPGALYLLLVLHYIEQECIAESSAVARPHNKTVERICAYLAANYRQKFSLSEVAARFYLSPYYLSRLFKRVTGQSIVDYINNRRIEAAQKLLETTELSISAVAEQTGFASAAHFRRVFHEVMGTGPLQYRKAHKNDGFSCGKQDAAQRVRMSACGRRGMPHGTMLCSVQHVPGDTSFTNKTPCALYGNGTGGFLLSDALCAAGQGLSP